MGTIPEVTLDGIAEAANMTEQELRLELGLLLYEQRKVSLGKATEIAGVSYDAFLHLMAARGITLDYGPEDLEEDLKTLDRLGY